MQNIKKTHWNTSFFVFSQHLTKFGPNLAPKTTHTLLFLTDFQWHMLRDSININNLCWNPVVLKKKWVKPLKNCFIGPNLHKKGVIMGHAQRGKQFYWAEITKADYQLSETFYFIKLSYFLTEFLNESFSVTFFCQKSDISS